MNINSALLKLNLKKKNLYDIKILKKHYHFLALKYHPDKNFDKNSKVLFQEINEAYIFLLQIYESKQEFKEEYKHECKEECNKKYTNKEVNDKMTFEELFENFISLLNIKSDDEIEIMKKYFINKYNYYNKLIFNKLSNNNYFKKLINLFKSIDEDYKEILIINTEIENILNNEIYKLQVLEELLFIPLWYKEVIYQDYLIKIKVINLENNIKIDLENNIYINIESKIDNLLNNDLIFNIGSKEFCLKNNLIYLKKNHTYKLENCGIINPYCEINDIDESVKYKSDIFINLSLY